MGERESEPSCHEHQSVVGDIFDDSERLLKSFSQTSAIGFAILDDQLRYQGINDCLANINGMPAKAHIGFTVREIFGEVSRTFAELSYHRVFNLGETSHFEVKNAVLPTKADSRFWALNTNFPLRDRAGRVREIGVLVVEVTEQRKLEQFLHKLGADLHHAKTQESFWHARELHDSIDQYHTALTMSLEHLIRDREKSVEPLAESIEVLDQRIIAMGKLVSSLAIGFSTDK